LGWGIRKNKIGIKKNIFSHKAARNAAIPSGFRIKKKIINFK